MTTKTNLILPIVLLGLIFGISTSIAQSPLPASAGDVSAISQAALNALNAQQARGDYPLDAGGDTTTSDIQISGDWGFGMIVTRALNNEHSGPDLRLFVARRSSTRAGEWQATVEYSEDFYYWLEQIPDDTFITKGAKDTLLASNPARAPRGDGSAELALPYATGETWYLSGGPHGNNGNSVRPWSALDLSIPDGSGGMGIGKIRAAREGYVYRTASCPNFVRVDHPDGWQTGYYHVNQEQVVNGEYIARGTFLGYTSSMVGCGGWSSGPHVHFTIRYYGKHREMDNRDIGGYNFQEGGAAYQGCFSRFYDNYEGCVGDNLYNGGIIGTNLLEGTGGEFINDTRYDYNGDKVPDVWAVNARNGLTDSVSMHVVSGNSLSSGLVSSGTGMPRQPVNLNTAFASGDYNGDNVPDLWVIHRWDGAGQTAYRIMDGTAPDTLIGNVITGLPIYGNNVSFLVENFDNDGVLDLWAVIPDDDSGYIRVQIADGNNPVFVLRDAITSVASPSIYDTVHFAASDWNLDGHRDLWVIYANDDLTNGLRVAIVSGKDFKTLLFNERTMLGQLTTDANELGFSATDYNRDGTPDLWIVRRDINRLMILHGLSFNSLLVNSIVSLPATNSDEWQILGSDRSRIIPSPPAPVLIKPEVSEVSNKPTLTFKWYTSGQAAKYRLKVKNASGVLVYKKAFKDLENYCTNNTCRIDLDQLGVKLANNDVYTWWIMAKNGTGKANSSKLKFATDIPGTPKILAPLGSEFTSGEPLTFSWQGTDAVDKYVIVVVNEDRTYKDKAVLFPADCPNQFCTYTFNTLFPPDTYKWKVKSKAKIGGQKYVGKATNTITMNVASLTRAPLPLRDPDNDVLETNGRLILPPEPESDQR